MPVNLVMHLIFDLMYMRLFIFFNEILKLGNKKWILFKKLYIFFNLTVDADFGQIVFK